MKKALLTTILGLTVAAASVQAQSYVLLYNYGAPSGSITYGTSGVGVTGEYTVGVYYAVGNIAASVNTAIGGATTGVNGNAGSLTGSGLTLGTGSGSTAPLGWDIPGEYDTGVSFNVDPSAHVNQTVTLVLVAYNGESYESSLVRGHSAAFTMPALAAPQIPMHTGNYSGTFAVVTTPEPSTFALVGIGVVSLLIFRTRSEG